MRFSGKIISGRGIGRKLGFPTLNFVIPANLKVTPGVFAARLFLGEKSWPAILFFGKRKTFDNQETLEIHVLNAFAENPNAAEFEILDKIREVQKFANETDLKKQIREDCQAARKFLNSKF